MSPTTSNSLGPRDEIVALIPALRAFAHRFARSENDVDDLVQDTVSRALGNLDKFEPGSSMKSWVFTIMRNRFCGGFKRERRESCGHSDDVATYDTPAAATQDWAMRAIDVDAALLLLGEKERKALLLVAGGESYEDAAITCGCKVGTIKSRVCRARSRLVELLGEMDRLAATSIN